MSMIDEFNIDRFKTEHECDEHWELRRKFLLAHQDKFELDELLCLAQVFTNVEFLGCKYPQETMEKISELSTEIIQDYREKQKTRLKRTFVRASDAAISKAKGQFKSNKSPKPENYIQSSYENYQQQSKRKLDLNIQESNLEVKRKKKDIFEQINLGDVVLFEYLNDTPLGIISRAANNYEINLDWKYEKINNDYLCSLFFNKHKVSEAISANQKAAKKEASIVALKKLQKLYYTIKVTKNLTPTITEDLGLQQESSESNLDALSSDNIGSKMMKLMGWSGGGLGKSSQGITEPVRVQQQMTREGLGLKPGLYNMHLFKKKCFEVLQNYVKGDILTMSDLVFSPNFSNEERAVIHQIAKQFGLKSQSYGPKNQRILTISQKINPHDLINELKKLGGSTEKYQLIEPTETK